MKKESNWDETGNPDSPNRRKLLQFLGIGSLGAVGLKEVSRPSRGATTPTKSTPNDDSSRDLKEREKGTDTGHSDEVLSRATDDNQYPTVDSQTVNAARKAFSDTNHSYATATAVHPSQDRIAFTSAALGHGLNLYIAEGITSLADSPEAVYRITKTPNAGVYVPQWDNKHRLQFQYNFTRYAVTIPKTYEVLSKQIINKNVHDDTKDAPGQCSIQPDNNSSADTGTQGVTTQSIAIPTPTRLPFSVCAPGKGVLHCVNAEHLVIGKPRECQAGTTPDLVSADITYAKKGISLGGTEVLASVSIWAGVETNASAVWIGEPVSGYCVRIPIDPSPTTAVHDIVDSISHIKDDLLWEIHKWGGPHPDSPGGAVLGALAIVVIAIALASPPYPVP